MPYITEATLIHGYLMPKLRGGYKDGDMDTDMALCKRAREKVSGFFSTLMTAALWPSFTFEGSLRK